MDAKLVLLRHGQSVWNRQNLFTGWWDADLTEQGEAEARTSGRAMADAGLFPTVVRTSLQVRAIRTATIALEEMGRSWIPVRRSWRLNERHYGDLTGKDKAATAAEFGVEMVKVWRRSYDVAPPAISPENEFNPNSDERYRGLPSDLLPASECLKDVVERVLPYWYDAVVPDLCAGRTVLVVAHGNSLRALIKHLDQISDEDIAELNLPTGVPLLYDLTACPELAPVNRLDPLERVVGDAEAARAAASAVSRQAG